MIYQAHRGVCTECPENTLPAFRKAWEQGYKVIEMDSGNQRTESQSPGTGSGHCGDTGTAEAGA